MVAEVPHPDCVFTTNPLSAGIAKARSAVEAFLHPPSRGLQPASPPIPVRLVGVGFFDTPSHGKGAPANGIELHPLLDVEFNPASAPPSTTGQQALVNGGFENGSAPWVADNGVITASTKRSPHTGRTYAWLGGYGKTHTDALHQELTLAANANRITLSYDLLVDTKEVDQGDFDTLTVELRTSAGARVATLAEYSNRDAQRAYVRRTFDLTQYRGQTLDLWFVAAEDHSLQTTFLIDDASVEVN
jgi:hypothetical protein